MVRNGERLLRAAVVHVRFAHVRVPAVNRQATAFGGRRVVRQCTHVLTVGQVLVDLYDPEADNVVVPDLRERTGDFVRHREPLGSRAIRVRREHVGQRLPLVRAERGRAPQPHLPLVLADLHRLELVTRGTQCLHALAHAHLVRVSEGGDRKDDEFHGLLFGVAVATFGLLPVFERPRIIP